MPFVMLVVGIPMSVTSIISFPFSPAFFGMFMLENTDVSCLFFHSFPSLLAAQIQIAFPNFFPLVVLFNPIILQIPNCFH